MRNRFSMFTTVFTLIVLILGILVVATEAGDACGHDWPKCNGKFYPDIRDPLQVIEYTHRLFTGALGFVILINGWVAWRKKIPGERSVPVLALLSILLLFLQAVVGGLNVLLGTPPGFTTFDVAISSLLLVSLVLLTVSLGRKPVAEISEEIRNRHNTRRRLFLPAFATTFSFYMEVILGAFFKHSAASEVLLHIGRSERLIDSLPAAELIYFLHGIFALTILIGALQLFFLAVHLRTLRRAATLLLVLIAGEIAAGSAAVISQLTVAVSSVHMILAILSLGTGAYIVGKAGLGETVLLNRIPSNRTAGA